MHDELDLPPGEVKTEARRRRRGHNGLTDIRAQLGTQDFWRLRIGIGHPRDSELTEQQVVDYVLKPPRAEERSADRRRDRRSARRVAATRAGDMERAMMKLHTQAK